MITGSDIHTPSILHVHVGGRPIVEIAFSPSFYHQPSTLLDHPHRLKSVDSSYILSMLYVAC